MAARKEFRDLAVSDFYRNGKSVPMIRVSGLWLEELGFKVGDYVWIKCENGQRLINQNKEKTQEEGSRVWIFKQKCSKVSALELSDSAI